MSTEQKGELDECWQVHQRDLKKQLACSALTNDTQSQALAVQDEAGLWLNPITPKSMPQLTVNGQG